MSRSRNKNHSEIEFIKGENRELKKQNKSLKQRLKRLEKREHLVEDSFPDQDIEISTDTEETFIKKILCQAEDCGKGYYQEYIIMDKCIGTCPICGDRKNLKKS